jgi:hypothetical protein
VPTTPEKEKVHSAFDFSPYTLKTDILPLELLKPFNYLVVCTGFEGGFVFLVKKIRKYLINVFKATKMSLCI